MFADRWACPHLSHAHGLSCRVWRIPSNVQWRVTASPVTSATRAVLTADALFIWQERTVTHARFVRLTGRDGLRLRLAPATVAVHQEAIAFPEHFSFVYKDPEAARQQDFDTGRCIVERWLKSNAHLRMLCSDEFAVEWYM